MSKEPGAIHMAYGAMLGAFAAFGWPGLLALIGAAMAFHVFYCLRYGVTLNWES